MRAKQKDKKDKDQEIKEFFSRGMEKNCMCTCTLSSEAGSACVSGRLWEAQSTCLFYSVVRWCGVKIGRLTETRESLTVG